MINERYMQKRIKDMPKDSYAWSVPWAMSVTPERNCYLNEDYSVHKSPGGTVSMQVYRDPTGEYEVDISGVRDFKWSESEYRKNSTWFAIKLYYVKDR